MIEKKLEGLYNILIRLSSEIAEIKREVGKKEEIDPYSLEYERNKEAYEQQVRASGFKPWKISHNMGFCELEKKIEGLRKDVDDMTKYMINQNKINKMLGEDILKIKKENKK